MKKKKVKASQHMPIARLSISFFDGKQDEFDYTFIRPDEIKTAGTRLTFYRSIISWVFDSLKMMQKERRK